MQPLAILLALAIQQPSIQQSIRIEVLRPIIDDAGLGPTANAWLLRPDLSISAGRTMGRFDLPIGIGSSGGTSIRFGNPYFGIRVPQEGAVLDFGARLPIAATPDDAASSAVPILVLLADFQHFEAWAPKLFSLQGRWSWLPRARIGFIGQGYVGGTFMASTQGGDPEFLIDYGGAIGAAGETVRFTGGIDGRLIVTGSGDLGQRTVHYFNGRIALVSGRVQPNLLVRVPLEDTGVLDLVIGLGVEIMLR